MPKENEQGQEKTEQPTEKRIQDSRKEGNVAKSQDLNSAAVLIAGLFLLATFGGFVMERLMEFTVGIYMRLDELSIDGSNFRAYTDGTAKYVLGTVLPFFIVIPVIGVIVNLIQVGLLFSTKAIQPKLDKLNPIKGFKNLVNMKAWVKLLMNIAKVVVVSYVAYWVVRGEWDKFIPLMDTDVGPIFIFLCKTILKVLIWTVAALAVLAIIDWIFQKRKHTEELKMSKQEVKDERRMMDGDPKVKQQQREMAFKLAFNKMIKELPNADVVVTNPTHVAVALKYDPATMEAPIVIGKGMRKLAQRIKEIAREHEIPIVEAPPLARSLYKSCEVGQEIPGDFYQDVAEIIAHIFRMKNGQMEEEPMV